MELLEFLNSCSPLRAVALMIFMLLVMFFTYTLIESVFKIIFGKTDSKKSKGNGGVLGGTSNNTDT